MHRRWLLLLTLGSWCVACGGTPESYVDGRFFGTRNGGPVANCKWVGLPRFGGSPALCVDSLRETDGSSKPA
jgi:hypothetical protein